MSGAATSVADRLSQRFSILPSDAGADLLSLYEVDGLRPSAVVQPADAPEISEVLRFATPEKLAVIPCGGRTKLHIGAPPARYDLALDVSRMSRVLAYDPRDLTLGVEPGISYRALSETLAAEKQFLPLAPPFADRATIGGILAADSASPLRQAYGGPRDFVLGMEFVTGEGIPSKSGGRVVKNVTGYDLHKALIGSLGTLAVITRVNFKTFPLPPASAVFVAEFASYAGAHAFCGAIVASPLSPQILELVSPEAGKLLAGVNLSTEQWSVVVTAAGYESVVARHARDLQLLAAQCKAADFAIREGAPSAASSSSLISALFEFPRIARQSSPAATLFRVATLPAAMPALVERIHTIAQRCEVPHAVVVRPYGLTYAALLPVSTDDASMSQLGRAAEEIFLAATELGAGARIESAPVTLKQRISVWGPRRDDFELMSRVKKVFDPAGVLSPGRFAGGI